MFGLFSSSKIVDPKLGELARSRGYWRGSIVIGPYTNVPLAVAGDRAAPDPAALAIAQEVATLFPTWSVEIAQALYEHYAPYAEAIAAGELPSRGEFSSKLASPAEIWPLVSLSFVSVAPLSGSLTIELGINVEWDEEHILGVRFQDGEFVELCGSTVPS